MALLAFYGGLVLGVAAGMIIMALLVMARTKEKKENVELFEKFERFPGCFKGLVTNPTICYWWRSLWEPEKAPPGCRKWAGQQCPTQGRKPREDSDDDGTPD